MRDTAKNARFAITVGAGAMIAMSFSVSFMVFILFPTTLLEIPKNREVFHLEFPTNAICYATNEDLITDTQISLESYNIEQIDSGILCTLTRLPLLGNNGKDLQIEVCLQYR